MDPIEWKVIDIKQRVVDMKKQLDNKSNSVEPDPQPVYAKKQSNRDLFRNVAQAAISDDQYASVLHNREIQLRERIEKVRSKLPLKK